MIEIRLFNSICKNIINGGRFEGENQSTIVCENCETDIM